MADKYWVGGSGTWNTTLTTNWRTTSGGSTVASVPTAADNVIFDANSGGTFTVTMTGALVCADITVSAGVVTFATGTTPTLSVYGSMSLIAATVWNSTGTISFLATSAKTISTNAVNIDAPITFNGVSGSWTLGSNFAFGKTAIRAMTMTNGTLDSANYTITSLFASTITNSANSNSLLNMNTALATTMTAGTLAVSGTFGAFTFTAGTINLSAAMTTGVFTHTAGTLTLNNFTFTCSTFLANGATVRTFAFGTSGSINVTYSGATATIWNQTTVGTLTVTGTPTVNIRSTATNTVTYTVTPGSPTEAQSLNFNFLSGSYNLAFLNVASNACRNINFTSLSGVWTGTGSNSGFGTGFAGTWNAFVACTIYGGITLSSLMTITAAAVTMTFTSTIAGSSQYFCLNGKNFLTTSFVFNGNWTNNVTYNTFYFLGYYDGTSTYVRTACMATTGVGTITVNSGTFDGYNVASPLLPGTSNVISGATGAVNFQNWASLVAISCTTGSMIFSSTVSSVSETGATGYNRNRAGPFTLVSGYLYVNGPLQTSAFTLTNGQINLYDKMVTAAFTFTAGTIAMSSSGTVPVLQVDSMAASGATTRTLSFGTGYIICLGTWDQTTVGTITINSTQTDPRPVYIAGGTKTIATGAPTGIQALDFYFYTGTGTLTFSSLVTRNLDFTGKTINIPFTGDTTYTGFTGTIAATPVSTVYGSLTLKSGMTLTESANTLTLGSTLPNARTLNTANISIPFPLTFDNQSTTITFQNPLTMGATVARALTVVSGNIDLNQKAITAGFSGSAMTVTAPSSSTTIYNMWRNTTIPLTINSTATTYFYANMTNPEAVNHWWNGGYPTGTATLSTYGGTGITLAGTMILQADFWMEPGSTFTYTSNVITLNGYEFVVGKMVASGATNRTIQFGTTGQVTTLGTGTVWDQTTIGTFTYTGTSKINITNYQNVLNSTALAQAVIPGVATVTNAQNFNFFGAAGFQGALTFLATATHAAGDVFFSSNWQSTWAATAACTIFGNFTLSSGVTLTSSAAIMTFGATSSKTFTSSGKTIPFPITFSGVGGTWVLQDALIVGPTLATTLANGTLNLNDLYLTTGRFVSNSATARTIAYGTSGTNRIVCNYATAGTVTVFDTSTVTNLTITGTYPIVQIYSTINSLTGIYSVLSGALTETNNFNFWFQGNFALTFLGTAGYTCRDIDFGYYGNFSGTWSATSTGTIYGSVILGGGMTLTTSASAMTFGATSGTKTFKSYGKALPFPVTLNAPGSTFQLTDAFALATATTAFTHTAGTLDLNAVTCTVGTYATGVGTKSLIFNTGYLYVSGSGVTAFNNANPLNYTVGPGGGYGFIFMSSATAKTFVGGGSNYDCYIVNSGAGALTISGNSTYTYLGLGYTILVTGSNSFKQIAAYYGSRVLTLTAGTTQTITVSGGWNVIGSAGDITTINSGTAGSLATITRNYAVNDATYAGSTDYVSLKDIQFLPSNTLGDGSLPNIWWAGSHSTNLGNNFGVTFTDWSGYATTSVKAYYISNTSTTSWTTPADWNPANNIVHMIGGGGGGSGSRFTTNTNRAGGAGGGGGGYTKITNYSAAVGTLIGVSVGTAGTAGAAGANGSFGTSTLFTNETTLTTYRASFNGTNQYLVVPQSSTLAMSADFCIEGWIYCSAFNTVILDEYPSGTPTGSYQLWVTAAGVLQFAYNTGVLFNFATIAANRWYHFAVTRSGTTMRNFLNGTLVNTTTYAGAIGLSNYDVWIGQQQSGGSYYWNGYMSNIRIVKGSPVYTANFCPTITPLTSITNTILLTCRASSISDGSGTFTITNPNSITTSSFALPYFAPSGVGGSTGTTTSTGGTGGVGSTYTGGAGGDGTYSATAAAGAGGGGGGGAAGPLGNGASGGASFATATTASVSGGGGGGNGGGTAGTAGTSGVSGKGGNNNAGIGGGATNGAAGTFGGGGASNVSAGAGGVGGTGVDIIGTWGGGGGTGGPAQLAATNALTTAYGAGGAGGGVTVATTAAAQLAGGNGGGGLIVIQYYPLILSPGTPGVGSGFFAFF
jgi:Concanavalin A-like lectin/glucanases superfamily